METQAVSPEGPEATSQVALLQRRHGDPRTGVCVGSLTSPQPSQGRGGGQVFSSKPPAGGNPEPRPRRRGWSGGLGRLRRSLWGTLLRPLREMPSSSRFGHEMQRRVAAWREVAGGNGPGVLALAHPVPCHPEARGRMQAGSGEVGARAERLPRSQLGPERRGDTQTRGLCEGARGKTRGWTGVGEGQKIYTLQQLTNSLTETQGVRRAGVPVAGTRSCEGVFPGREGGWHQARGSSRSLSLEEGLEDRGEAREPAWGAERSPARRWRGGGGVSRRRGQRCHTGDRRAGLRGGVGPGPAQEGGSGCAHRREEQEQGMGRAAPPSMLRRAVRTPEAGGPAPCSPTRPSSGVSTESQHGPLRAQGRDQHGPQVHLSGTKRTGHATPKTSNIQHTESPVQMRWLWHRWRDRLLRGRGSRDSRGLPTTPCPCS